MWSSQWWNPFAIRTEDIRKTIRNIILNSKSKIVSGKMLELFQITICINSRYQQRGNIWYEKNKSWKKYGNRGKTKKYNPEKHDSFIWVLEIVYKLKVGNRNRHASGAARTWRHVFKTQTWRWCWWNYEGNIIFDFWHLKLVSLQSNGAYPCHIISHCSYLC